MADSLYLKRFTLPTLQQETKRWYCNEYPFGIFPLKELHTVEFSNVTIFYGGNGSGKTTLLNLIAQSLRLPRITLFNNSERFEEYVRTLCIAETRKKNNSVPYGSAIFTSDDIFHDLIDRRVRNEDAMSLRQASRDNYHEQQGKDLNGVPAFQSMEWDEDGIPSNRSREEYAELTDRLASRKLSQSQFVDARAGRLDTPDSNGQYALSFFENHFAENCLYLLDEPENSLSPKYQLKVAELIENYARFFGCQFVLSTHSPFFLSMKGALIYDLDSVPVTTKCWWELENIRLTYRLFEAYRDKFEKE